MTFAQYCQMIVLNSWHRCLFKKIESCCTTDLIILSMISPQQVSGAPIVCKINGKEQLVGLAKDRYSIIIRTVSSQLLFNFDTFQCNTESRLWYPERKQRFDFRIGIGAKRFFYQNRKCFLIFFFFKFFLCFPLLGRM